MANPYHDETGKFCARGEMIAAIDRVALSGDSNGYLKIRAEFEEAEKGKFLISTEDLLLLTQTAHIYPGTLNASDQYSTSVIGDNQQPLTTNALREQALEEIYDYFDSKQDGFGFDFSDYNSEKEGKIDQYFINSDGDIPLIDRVNVYEKLGDYNNFDQLIFDSIEAKEIFKQKPELFYDAYNHFKEENTLKARANEAEILQVLANEAKTKEDISFVIENAPYNYHYVPYELALHPEIDLDNASRLLDKLAVYGTGNNYYWQARHYLVTSLTNKYGEELVSRYYPEIPTGDGISDSDWKNRRGYVEKSQIEMANHYKDAWNKAYSRAGGDTNEVSARVYANETTEANLAYLDSLQDNYNRLEQGKDTGYEMTTISDENIKAVVQNARKDRARGNASIRNDANRVIYNLGLAANSLQIQ